MEHYTPSAYPVMSFLCRASIFNYCILDLHVSKVIANNVIIYLNYEIHVYTSSSTRWLVVHYASCGLEVGG